MIGSTIKQVCSFCLKNINIGQSIFECHICNCVLHTKCFKQSKSEIIENDYYCIKCKHLAVKKYNPFSVNNFDDDLTEVDENIHKISQILENCRSHSVDEFNHTYRDNFSKHTAMFFLNIDGNKSNFDSLAAELERYTHKFPIIGIAETNIDPDVSSVYQLPEYTSFYQSTQPGKAKGTGVALYIHNSLNATVNNTVSFVTPNLETLFITVSHDRVPLTVGVLYRHPNGNVNESLSELSNILETLPKKAVYIMGDFNINLHNDSTKIVSDFEEVTLSTGFAPLISIHTHEKPNCNGTCIDNILTNDVDNVLLSGTIRDKLLHHLPIFQIFDWKTVGRNEDKHMQF